MQQHQGPIEHVFRGVTSTLLFNYVYTEPECHHSTQLTGSIVVHWCAVPCSALHNIVTRSEDEARPLW